LLATPSGLRDLVLHALPSGHHRDDVNAQRSGAGWVTPRDKLHGRVVDRRPVVEMAPPYMLDAVVNGRAADPAPRRQRACSCSPAALARAAAGGQGAVAGHQGADIAGK
jgi:hypothetical protein